MPLMVVMSSEPDVSRVAATFRPIVAALHQHHGRVEKGDSLNRSSRVPFFTPLVLTKKAAL